MMGALDVGIYIGMVVLIYFEARILGTLEDILFLLKKK